MRSCLSPLLSFQIWFPLNVSLIFHLLSYLQRPLKELWQSHFYSQSAHAPSTYVYTVLYQLPILPVSVTNEPTTAEAFSHQAGRWMCTSHFLHQSICKTVDPQRVFGACALFVHEVPRFIEHWCCIAADSWDDGTEAEVMEKRTVAIIWSNRKRRKAIGKEDGRESRWQIVASEHISIVARVPAVFANPKLL